MALMRNIAGVHKLGSYAESSPDMEKMLPDSEGGGAGGWLYPDGSSDYQPVYDLRPPDQFEPDGADVVDLDGIHPVHPIEPIYGYDEEPSPVEVPVNTVQVTPQGQRVVDITAVGALAAVLFMAIGPRPKGLLGG